MDPELSRFLDSLSGRFDRFEAAAERLEKIDELSTQVLYLKEAVSQLQT